MKCIALLSAENRGQAGEGDEGREQDHDGGHPRHDDTGTANTNIFQHFQNFLIPHFSGNQGQAVQPPEAGRVALQGRLARSINIFDLSRAHGKLTLRYIISSSCICCT